MTEIKTFIICLVFVLTGILTVQGQAKFEVPQNIQLKSKGDYAKYETAIIDASKWLEETDLNIETAKRQQINEFVLQWVSGSPIINVDINEQLSKIYGKNVQLLGIYLANYARNFLENKSSATKYSALKAGIVSMMNVYKKGINISKNKEMERLIKLSDDNKFDDYVRDKFM
jgi:hypothetical protein